MIVLKKRIHHSHDFFQKQLREKKHGNLSFTNTTMSSKRKAEEEEGGCDYILATGKRCGRPKKVGDRCGYHKNRKQDADLPPLGAGMCKGITQRGRRCRFTAASCPDHDENGKPKPRKKKRKRKKLKEPAAPAAPAPAAPAIECVCRHAPSDFERAAAVAFFGWDFGKADEAEVLMEHLEELEKVIERVVINCGAYLGAVRGKSIEYVAHEKEEEEEGGGDAVAAAAAGEPEEEEEGEGKVIKYSQELRDEINHAIAIGDLSAFKSSLASKINLNRIKENSDSAVKE